MRDIMNWHEGLRRIKLAGRRLMLSTLTGAVTCFLLFLVFHVSVFESFLMIGVPLLLGALLLLVAWILEWFLELSNRRAINLLFYGR
jgi:hypothetical protein